MKTLILMLMSLGLTNLATAADMIEISPRTTAGTAVDGAMGETRSSPRRT